MTPTRINRRRFLLTAGGALGASALACGGLAALATRKPEIDLAESTYGEADSMSGRILVAYASTHGSTAGVADAIGKALAQDGVAVDVRCVKEVEDLASYRAVVAGSAIYGNAWLPEALEFVQAHQAELQRVPTALFLVCGTLANSPEQRDTVAEWLQPVRSLVPPVAEGRFAGAVRYKIY